MKAHLAVPDHWAFTEVPSGDSLIYQIVPAGPAFDVPSRARYQMVVRRDLNPEVVVEHARQFVEAVRQAGFPIDSVETQKLGVLTMFASVVEFGDSESGDHESTVAVSALANYKTGTLYTIRFDIPASELALVAPLANSLFRRIRLDDEI